MASTFEVASDIGIDLFADFVYSDRELHDREHINVTR